MHYINKEFHRQHKILCTEPLRGSHTGRNIAQAFHGILDGYGISNNSVHIVLRDAGSSMIKSLEELELTSFDCMCHKIQLVCVNILNKISIDFLGHKRRMRTQAQIYSRNKK